MMAIRIGILADDLSGGMNIGVEFSQAGYRTVLRAPDKDADADVLIVDTATRNIPPNNAYQANREAARALHDLAPQIVVKKIDSLMRGNIGQEIDAVMDTLGYTRCLLTPASPKLKRQVIGGVVMVADHPLAEQQQKLDPLGAMTTSHVTAILAAQSGRPIIRLDIDTIRRGDSALAEALNRIADGIIAADCLTQTDLNRVVGAAYQAGIRFFAGTYGMGEAVCAALRTPTEGRVLVVVGSLSEAARRQTAFLRDHLPCSVIQPEYDARFFEETPEVFAAPYADALKAAIQETSVAVVQLAPSSAVVEALYAMSQARGISLVDLQARVEGVMAAIIGDHLSQFDGFVATGGATAGALLGLLDATGLTLERTEVIPGVPLARLHGGTYDKRPYIIKPGSQGADDALFQLVRAIQGASYRET